MLASYLNLHTLVLADAHVTEAATLATATETQSQKVMTQVHNHEPDDAELIQALQLGQKSKVNQGPNQSWLSSQTNSVLMQTWEH